MATGNQVKVSELTALSAASTAVTDLFVVQDVSATKTKTATGAVAKNILGLTGANVDGTTLKGWCSEVMKYVNSRTYASDGIELQSGTLIWPDASTGTFTVTTWNSTFFDVDAWTASHSDSSQTVTQSAVTRNSVGSVTSSPAMTVA